MKIKKLLENKNVYIYGYLFLYCVFLLVIHTLHTIPPYGEWDDYMLPIASLLNGGHIDIYPEDVQYFKTLFPSWATYVDSYNIAPFYTRSGGQMTYYFPTYSIVCMPMVLLLKVLHLNTVYGMFYTNIFVLGITLGVVNHLLKNLSFKKRFLLILALSINPIVFYIGWASAEVFIYSMILLGIVFWYKKCKKRAAFFISIAGTLNPTIMSIGMVMIAEWMMELIVNRDKSDNVITFIQKNIVDALEYGCCYVIGIVPMIYNFYHTGKINLTASTDASFTPLFTTLKYMLSYLLDLNYGYLPYFSILLIFAFIGIVIAIRKRHVRYLTWMFAFFLNMFFFSLMSHINCGMNGIARYCAWQSPLLICGVILFVDELIDVKKVVQIAQGCLLVGVIGTGCIIGRYDVYISRNIPYTFLTPVASFVLDNFPSLYAPLHSTFNSRVNHMDGGYVIEAPVVYTSTSGYVTKILACKKDAKELLETYVSYSGDNSYLEEQVNELTEEETYISIPQTYKVAKKAYACQNNETIDVSVLQKGDYLTYSYTNDQMNLWENSLQADVRIHVEDNTSYNVKLHLLNREDVKGMKIYVNGNEVYTVHEEDEISFTCTSEDEILDMKFIISSYTYTITNADLEDYVLTNIVKDIIIEEG